MNFTKLILILEQITILGSQSKGLAALFKTIPTMSPLITIMKKLMLLLMMLTRLPFSQAQEYRLVSTYSDGCQFDIGDGVDGIKVIYIVSEGEVTDSTRYINK